MYPWFLMQSMSFLWIVEHSAETPATEPARGHVPVAARGGVKEDAQIVQQPAVIVVPIKRELNRREWLKSLFVCWGIGCLK